MAVILESQFQGFLWENVWTIAWSDLSGPLLEHEWQKDIRWSWYQDIWKAQNHPMSPRYLNNLQIRRLQSVPSIHMHNPRMKRWGWHDTIGSITHLHTKLCRKLHQTKSTLGLYQVHLRGWALMMVERNTIHNYAVILSRVYRLELPCGWCQFLLHAGLCSFFNMVVVQQTRIGATNMR